jgi:hypothetical protein
MSAGEAQIKMKNTFVEYDEEDDEEALGYRLMSMPAPRINRLLSQQEEAQTSENNGQPTNAETMDEREIFENTQTHTGQTRLP